MLSVVTPNRTKVLRTLREVLYALAFAKSGSEEYSEKITNNAMRELRVLKTASLRRVLRVVQGVSRRVKNETEIEALRLIAS